MVVSPVITEPIGVFSASSPTFSAAWQADSRNAHMPAVKRFGSLFMVVLFCMVLTKFFPALALFVAHVLGFYHNSSLERPFYNFGPVGF